MNKEYSMKVKDQELKFDLNVWRCIYNTLKEDIPDIEDNFYDGIVKNLKAEAQKLNSKLEKLRDNHDMNMYISTLKSLRETLELIAKYDWQLHYSEYGVKDGNGDYIKQISVWKQNHDNQIRNHKYWQVKGEGVRVPNPPDISYR